MMLLPDDVLATILLQTDGSWKLPRLLHAGSFKQATTYDTVAAASVCKDFHRILSSPRTRCQLMVRCLLRKIVLNLGSFITMGADAPHSHTVGVVAKAAEMFESEQYGPSHSFAWELASAMTALTKMSHEGVAQLAIAAFSKRPHLIRRLVTQDELDEDAGKRFAYDSNVQHYLKQRLRNVVTRNQVEVVRILVHAGASLNVVDDFGRTPLHDAILDRRNMEIVRILVHAGAALNVVDKRGHNALVDALLLGDAAVVQLLVDANATLDGTRALEWAVDKNYIELVNVLAAHGAPLNVANAHGYTPILSATWNDNADMVRALLRAGADPNVVTTGTTISWVSSLMIAATYGYRDVVDVLVDEGHANLELVDHDGNTALMLAAESGHFGVVRYLVESGASLDTVNLQGETALTLGLATRRRDEEMCRYIPRYLINAGATPESMLHRVARRFCLI